jgi:hypothetical protein
MPWNSLTLSFNSSPNWILGLPSCSNNYNMHTLPVVSICLVFCLLISGRHPLPFTSFSLIQTQSFVSWIFFLCLWFCCYATITVYL